MSLTNFEIELDGGTVTPQKKYGYCAGRPPGQSGSFLEQDSPDALLNLRAPQIELVSEKPEHRIIILLKAQALSHVEIAQRTGYTAAHISNILRQPWARRRLVEEINLQGRDAISELLKGEVPNNIFKLIEVRDTAPKHSDVIAASKELLDRYLGKPMQRVETVEKKSFDTDDVRKLDDAIAEQEREIARLQGVETLSTSTNSSPASTPTGQAEVTQRA